MQTPGDIGRARARALMRSHTMRELAPWIRANYRPIATIWTPLKPGPAEYTHLDPEIIPAIRKNLITACANYDHRFQADRWFHQRALLDYLALAPPALTQDYRFIYEAISDAPEGLENPYEAAMRAAFQTRILRITNSRLIGKAHKCNASALKQILGRIVHDQRRHERFYSDLLAKIFAEDPKGAHDIYNIVINSTNYLR